MHFKNIALEFFFIILYVSCTTGKTNCSSNCESAAKCDSFTGECSQCKLHFLKPYCTECVNGSWSGNCSEKCGKCKNKQGCNQKTGACTECEEDYMPPLCRVLKQQKKTRECKAKKIIATVGSFGFLWVVATIGIGIYLWKKHKKEIQTDKSDTSKHAGETSGRNGHPGEDTSTKASARTSLVKEKNDTGSKIREKSLKQATNEDNNTQKAKQENDYNERNKDAYEQIDATQTNSKDDKSCSTKKTAEH